MFKRLIDLALVILFAPLIVAIIAVAACAVFLSDGHSPFYTQKRLGRDGRTFRLWKLRTMVHNAEEVLEAYLIAHPEARAEWDAHQKLKNDVRVTRVGKFLRKTSLDEFPQFLNVLVGDMSLVGPRPIMANQRSLYFGHAYYETRPGLTGPWQVSDRHETQFAERVHFDDVYYDKMSFRTDASILFRTVFVVLRGTGC